LAWTDVRGLLLAAFFVVLNGWFVLAEFALVKVRTTRLRELADEGKSRASLALRITGRLDDYLSAIQLGITLTSLALGWIGEPSIARVIAPAFERLPGGAALTHGIAVGVAFGSITFLHVVVGEQVPKMMGILRAERFALWVALPLHAFYLVTLPVTLVLRGAANGMCRALGFEPSGEGGDPYTEEELRMIVAASHAQGVLNEATRYLLDNVLDYTTRIVREVMTPRRDVLTLDVKAPVADSIALALDREFSRYLLVDSSKDQVIGFIHLKDVVSIATGRKIVESLKDVARPAVFVPEFVPIDRARRQLQARSTHLGVVVDELGDFVGIVTLEDLLEELVGEIQDETDSEQPKVQRQPDGSALVDGSLLLETAIKKLGLQIDEKVDGIDTIGGYVFTRLGRAPREGDAIIAGRHRLEVRQVDRLRIRRLRVMTVEPPTPPA
jgi:CBS domain containing-hemolysin-like protein